MPVVAHKLIFPVFWSGLIASLFPVGKSIMARQPHSSWHICCIRLLFMLRDRAFFFKVQTGHIHKGIISP